MGGFFAGVPDSPDGAWRAKAATRRLREERASKSRAVPRVPVWLQAAGILVGIATGITVMVREAAQFFR